MNKYEKYEKYENMKDMLVEKDENSRSDSTALKNRVVGIEGGERG